MFSEKPDIEQRMMMYGSINGCVGHVAMNDVVITRDGGLRVVHFRVYVNGTLLNSYLADGMQSSPHRPDRPVIIFLREDRS